MNDFLKENDDGSVTVTLKKGITIDGAELKSVTMREPTVDDQIAASEIKGSEAQQEVALVANLCTIAPADVRGMTMRDYRRVQVALAGFSDTL